MSYGRNPYYIYSDGDFLFMNGDYIPEDVIDAFLYKILLTYRREELKRRLQNGKNIWFERQIDINDEGYITSMSKDNKIYKLDVKRMEEGEDDILKQLMSMKTE